MEKGQDRQGIKKDGGNSTDKWEQSVETDGAKSSQNNSREWEEGGETEGDGLFLITREESLPGGDILV